MEAITEFLESFDFAKLLPEIGALLSSLRFWMGVLIMVGPVLVLVFGLCYYFKPIAQPSDKLGFRVRCAMGSNEAWHFAQKLAGTVWMYLGAGLTVVSLAVLLLTLAAEPMTVALVAVICVAVQALLILVSYFFLLFKVSSKYNKHGDPK